MKHELLIILDFGGQYNKLIARRVRDLNVYSEVIPYDTDIEIIKSKNPIGIIFTGGPSVVTEENAPIVNKEIFNIGVPILGICYGCQLIGYLHGLNVIKAKNKEYGKTKLTLNNKNDLFNSIKEETLCWMSHTYHLDDISNGFEIIASTENCKVAAIFNKEKKLYGVQFHPEVIDTPEGNNMLSNFLYKICKAKKDWIVKNISYEIIENLKKKIGNKKVLCALSGGVDSSVAALLVHKAINKNITCIFVDTGLMRLNEGRDVEEVFKNKFDMNFIKINAEERFLSKLKGIIDPEEKRKIIGEEFIRIFEEEAEKIGYVDYLVQGTIYPDIVESGINECAKIKSHHNVGGLPDIINFDEIIEPLKDLFKDEVRKVGIELEMTKDLVYRQPFPGPGLAIRIIGEVTKEKLDILRKSDFIFRDEIKKAELDKKIWQYFTVLTDVKSVGVMGDERSYGYTLALRAVDSIDAMSADWYKIPYEVLENISIRIVNEVENINRVVYDITSKPPATIEWE